MLRQNFRRSDIPGWIENLLLAKAVKSLENSMKINIKLKVYCRPSLQKESFTKMFIFGDMYKFVLKCLYLKNVCI